MKEDKVSGKRKIPDYGLDSFRDLVKAGFPPEHIAEQIRKHIDALKALPPDTPDRNGAIAASEALLDELHCGTTIH